VVNVGAQVTVSAKIDRELRKKMTYLGIKPSVVIKRALEDEVREKSTMKVLAEAAKASEILKKVSEENWTDSIRKSRDER
jgi:predicted Holliday junction resolvase-like endonuclease